MEGKAKENATPQPQITGGMKKLNIIFWIAGILSMAAAWTSLVTGYKDRHSPFSPVVSFGSPALAQSSGVVSVAVPLSLSNGGMETGCIRDLSLKLQSKATHTRWVLFPAFFLDMSSYFRNTANKADAFASFDSPLFPIKLSGHETLNKAVLFMPRPPSGLQPLRAGDLTPDDIYSFELSILPASADCSIAVDARYVPAMRGEYKISQNMVQQLSAGLKVIVLDESTDSLRGAVLNAP